MADGEADFTLVFRHLADALESGDDRAVICLFQRPESITAWLKTWRSRLSSVEPRRAVARDLPTERPVYDGIALLPEEIRSGILRLSLSFYAGRGCIDF